MSMKDYYPAGAYSDPRAPYNQEDAPLLTMDVDACISLHFTVSIETDEYEFNDNDQPFYSGGDIEREIKENNYRGLKGLLAELRDIKLQQLKATDDLLKRQRRNRQLRGHAAKLNREIQELEMYINAEMILEEA